MRSIIALLPLALAGAPHQDPLPVVTDADQFVFHAVLEGLYADGVRNDVIDALMSRDEITGWPRHFIYACPICMPSWDAFATYRARPGFLGSKLERNTFGGGLDEATRATLMSGTTSARMQTLRGLVKRWIGRRLTLLRLTDAEREAYDLRFEEFRKKALEYLEAYRAAEQTAHLYRDVDFCPFCDGACEPDRR